MAVRKVASIYNIFLQYNKLYFTRVTFQPKKSFLTCLTYGPQIMHQIIIRKCLVVHGFPTLSDL